MIHYSLEAIKEEAQYLVDKKKISPQQRIQCLCEFIPPNQWVCFESELEKNDYLLRDYIIDLLDGQQEEEWD
jgi:hypothetical protein